MLTFIIHKLVLSKFCTCSVGVTTNVSVFIYSFSFFTFQQVSQYFCNCKTQRWPLCLFYNLLDVSYYNAFVLWSHITPEWKWGCLHRHCTFLRSWGELSSRLLSSQQPGYRKLPLPGLVWRLSGGRQQQQRAHQRSKLRVRGRGAAGFCAGCVPLEQPRARGRSFFNRTRELILTSQNLL